MEKANLYIPLNKRDINERPREKLLQWGFSVLSDAEILALLISTGTNKRSAIEIGQDIIDELEGLKGISKADIKRLTRIKGIGEAKAITIAAAFELAKRKQLIDVNEVQFKTPESVASYLIPRLAELEREVFHVLFINSNLHLIREETLFLGGINSSIVDVRLLMKRAIDCLATHIIVSHNHPSGALYPSNADIQITQKIKEAGKILEIQLIDHLIISNKGYYSFADNNIL